MERKDKLNIEHGRRLRLVVAASAAILLTVVLGLIVTQLFWPDSPVAEEPPDDTPTIITPPDDPPDEVEPEPEPEPEPAPPELPAALIVSVDNKVEARPQTGLDQADLVFEVLAEWRITRFIAFFYSKAVPKIGPVRSMRDYTAHIIAPYRTPFAHAGGSSDGLKAIRDLRIPDLDEIYNSQPAFWRDNSRIAPHNLYTSTDLMIAEATRRGLTMSPLPELPRGEMGSGLVLDELSIVYSIRNPSLYLIDYKAEWKWDGEVYVRSMNGQPHLTTEGTQITTDNIVVLSVEHRDIMGSGTWDTQMDVIGGGEALFMRDGVSYKGTWRKPTAHDHFEFQVNGQTYRFKPGNVWIQVVPGMGVVHTR
jgi:hypothetical protein